MTTTAQRQGIGFDSLILLGIVLGGLYLASRVLGTAGAAVQAGAGMIANLWVSLTTSPMQLQGTFQLPDGTQLPLAKYPIRQDAQGNVYTNFGGTVYQLAPWVLDANGAPTYPATPVGT